MEAGSPTRVQGQESLGPEGAGGVSLQLAYAISHDLRAQLRAIHGFGRQLSASPRLDADDQARLQRMRSAAEDADALLCELVDWLRVDAGSPRASDVDLGFLTDWALSELQAQDPATLFELEAPASLPMRGDESLLKLLMRDLLRHARAGVAAGEAVRVHIEAEPVDTGWMLRVQDQGAVFAPSSFEPERPFQPVGDPVRAARSGLSLAVARRIAQRHGGWLEVEHAQAPYGCSVRVCVRGKGEGV